MYTKTHVLKTPWKLLNQPFKVYRDSSAINYACPLHTFHILARSWTHFQSLLYFSCCVESGGVRGRDGCTHTQGKLKSECVSIFLMFFFWTGKMWYLLTIIGVWSINNQKYVLIDQLIEKKEAFSRKKRGFLYGRKKRLSSHTKGHATGFCNGCTHGMSSAACVASIRPGAACPWNRSTYI